MTGIEMPIPFCNVAWENRELYAELNTAIDAVLKSGAYIRGAAVAEFENAFAGYLGAGHAVGVASGTDALHLLLRAAGIGPGHEVITTPNTFIATAMAIMHAGAHPVLVDVDHETLNLNPSLLSAALTDKTRAVIPVHLYGQPADMAEISAFAGKHGLVVIEDACQAHGALYRNKKAGTLALAAGFSFYPTKNLGAAGDAGMAVTDDADLAARVRMLGNYGSAVKDRHEFPGFNSRLDSLQAAMLMVKLKHLDTWNTIRQDHAKIYREVLGPCDAIRLPVEKSDRTHVYHQFVIRVPAGIRSELSTRLSAKGIPTMIHYPAPIHLQPAFAFLNLGPGAFPEAEAAAKEILSLPIHQSLAAEQISHTGKNIILEISRLI